MDEWYDLLQNKNRILIEAARGHGKTIFFSIAYPLWLVYRGNPVDILLISYSEDQVKNNIMNKIDEIIHNNDMLASLRPKSGQLWGAQLKTFESGAQIRGESFGSSVRGAHPDYLGVDDPLKDKGSMTPEEQGNYFFTALSGTAKRHTKILVVGTPLDYGDLLEQLETNQSYTFRAYPAKNLKGEVLFTQLFNEEDLAAKEKEIGSFAFSREFLLQRIDPHTQVFKDVYRTVNDLVEFPKFAVVRTIIDPAISEKDIACDSAIVTAGVDEKNNVWELSTNLVHSDDPSKILGEIVRLAAQYTKLYWDYAIVIEAEVFQKILAYDLRQKLIEKGIDVRVIEVRHTGNQGKQQRIIGLQSAWEAKAIHLLPNSPLIAQSRYFRPNAKVGKVDALDALSWIRHLDVCQPIVNAEPVEGVVPQSAWE